MYSKNENIYTYNLTIVPSGRDQKKGGSISRFMLAMLKVGGPRQKNKNKNLKHQHLQSGSNASNHHQLCPLNTCAGWWQEACDTTSWNIVSRPSISMSDTKLWRPSKCTTLKIRGLMFSFQKPKASLAARGCDSLRFFLGAFSLTKRSLMKILCGNTGEHWVRTNCFCATQPQHVVS